MEDGQPTTAPTHRFIFAVSHPELDISDTASEFMLAVLGLAKKMGMNPIMSYYSPLPPDSYDAEGVDEALKSWQ